jgi:hypothetical protein
MAATTPPWYPMRCSPHDIRHAASLRPRISAQLQLSRAENAQIRETSLSGSQNREPTRGAIHSDFEECSGTCYDLLYVFKGARSAPDPGGPPILERAVPGPA